VSKLIVVEGLSLDGVMQGPGSPDEDRSGGFEHGGWQIPYFDEVAASEIGKSMGETGAFLFGRRTYEIMAAYWPHQPEGAMFADVLNGLPKYVVASTLGEPLEWAGSTLLKGNVAVSVTALKEKQEGTIVVLGSGQLARYLLENDLVDEWSLTIHPLLLGGGKRLFDGTSPVTRLELVNATPTGTGVIMATYRPQR
jgi:dihydrofolate reductase